MISLNKFNPMYSSMTAIIKTQSKVLVHQLALRLRYRRQLEAAVEEKRVDIVIIDMFINIIIIEMIMNIMIIIILIKIRRACR